MSERPLLNCGSDFSRKIILVFSQVSFSAILDSDSLKVLLIFLKSRGPAVDTISSKDSEDHRPWQTNCLGILHTLLPTWGWLSWRFWLWWYLCVILSGSPGLFRNQFEKCPSCSNTIPSVLGTGWGRQRESEGWMVPDSFHSLVWLDPPNLKRTLIPELIVSFLRYSVT